ncbi:hypothetical protein K490DRAFT_33603 [Saccharata proteae CBS 121410]|uniref:Aminoglycoside phosphotransferase domain-containing protein n=1 Tax=Saccharata proteae CBS 121410 TaxID=1314787 RepID=A0A9P4I0R1_9PEZI|nr:hypothetical protein K490DRAFT_33603 [Saccharata proteae CBS 121410]
MLHQNPTDSWGATRSITEAELVALTLRLTDPNNTTGGAGISLVKKAHGSFNQIYIMQLPSGAKRAIRVPGRGQVGVWNDSDAAGLSNQVLVMKYIRNTTTLPVPGVFAYDTTHNNEIGYPFMMMEGIAGKNVSDVWGWRQELTPELEGKRLRILKSLAVTMTSLRHIDFPALGRLDFDGEDFENPSVVAVGPGNRSSRQYFEDRYDELVRTMRYAHGGSRERHVKLEMVRMLMEALPCSATNTPANAPPETFVLRAPDFNWQNIMVDDTGDVVAIIDWDGVETVPRFLGWAKPPMFLCADFDPSWSWQGGPGNAPSKLEFYRKEYARFMAEAMGGQGDCVYAGKSHLYDHVLGALEEPTLTSDIIDRLLVAAIPRVSWEKISARVVERGWAPGEKEFIQERLQLLMRPVAGADHNFSF